MTATCLWPFVCSRGSNRCSTQLQWERALATGAQTSCSCHCSAGVQDAMLSFEASMDEAAIPQAAFNLLVCTFVLGHPDRCKQSYTRLAQVSPATTSPAVYHLTRYSDADQHLYLITFGRWLALCAAGMPSQHGSR